MPTSRAVAALAALLSTYGITACSAHDRDGGTGSSAATATRAETIDPEDRIAHGCALVRGGTQGDATTRHYAGVAAHAMFRAALEADPDLVTAARLWNAADQVKEDDSSGPRAALLRICTDAGFEDTAGLEELHAFACRVSSGLAKERPHVTSFGPGSGRRAPGDARRTDAQFLDVVVLLLSMKVDRSWLGTASFSAALDSEDDATYQIALGHFEKMCSRPSLR